MKSLTSKFLFICTNTGSERALKKEIKGLHPGWHPAYSRPGFVTFKAVQGSPFVPEVRIASIFARAYGLCLFNANLSDLAGKLEEMVNEHLQPSRMRLHVFCREEPDEEKQARTCSVAESLRRTFPGAFYEDEKPCHGDTVLDIIIVEENDIWAGAHQHHKGHTCFAGGRPNLELPHEAPSRSFLKMKEALLITSPPVNRGDTAIEIGSSPGGSSYCLLQHGINVIGVDSAQMSEVCLDFQTKPWFKHFACTAAKVEASDLPSSVEWLVLDMNVRPSIAIKQAKRIVHMAKKTLLGAFLTLKINDDNVLTQLPSALRQVRGMGFTIIQKRQLSYNRGEIFVYCLTKLGKERLKQAEKKLG
jgi:23S rRNA (cytidine2498-2'-O)-methyltransferase